MVGTDIKLYKHEDLLFEAIYICWMSNYLTLPLDENMKGFVSVIWIHMPDAHCSFNKRKAIDNAMQTTLDIFIFSFGHLISNNQRTLILLVQSIYNLH